MSRRTSWLTTVLVLGALGSLAGCGADAKQTGSTTRPPELIKAGQLTVCTSMPYEPFEFTRDGKPTGFDIDLAAEVAKRLNLQPLFLNKDFDAIASGELLNDGTCDVAVAGLTIAGDRARVIDFSSPYFNAAQTLVVSDSSQASSLADLAGGDIAVQSGTTGETYVTDNAPSTAKIVTFKDVSLMAGAIESGNVAGAVYDNTVVGDVLSAHSDLKVAATFDTGEQYGMAVKKNGSVDLLRVIDDVLATLKSNGGYDKIYADWFGAKPTA
jgi:polar amino acid transport system substrate-binding protein